MSDKEPPYTAGRGGRGAAILKALQSLSRQPGQAASQPTPSVPPSVTTGGAGILSTDGASGRPSEASAQASPLGRSRGAAIMSQLMQRQAAQAASSITSPGAGEEQRKEETSAKSLGRGRAQLMQALKTSTVTTQPTGKPLQPESLESDSLSSSVTESMQHLELAGATQPKEKDAIVRQGSSGDRIPASANWIRLIIEEEKAVFEYEVKFEPSIDAAKFRFQLLNSVRDKMGSVKSFDGSMLWLPIKLAREITVFETTHPVTSEAVTLKVIFKKRLPMDKCLQLYNVLFNRIMKVLKMVKVGFSHYSPSGTVVVPQHKLEIWPGYVAAAHFQEGGLMLCLDISHRVLRTETCYEIMSDIVKTHRNSYKEKITKVLVGSIVLTRYNNRTYRVDDILFEQNPLSTFTNYKGEEVKYIDYYRNVYDIPICDPQQPLLLHKVKNRDVKEQGSPKILCLIPELCYMTGLTDEMRSDFRIMKDIAQHTRITPNVRLASLRTYIRNVNENPDAHKILADWGLTLDDKPISMDGRRIPPEAIYFKNKQIPGSENADWNREACREHVILPIDLKPQCWLVIFSHRDEPRAQKFVEMMKQVTRTMGMRVGDPQLVRLPDDRIEGYVNSLKQYHHEKLQIAVCIFPTIREDRYSAVKRISCVTLGLPTQCINSKTISQDTKLRSVTQKIALQINCKLGGELWALKIPITGLMVCGVDVYHDPVRRGASVVGFVASTNQTLTQWYSRVTFQHPGDEIVHGLRMSLLGALRQYHMIHGSLPRSIILYRDGVGDGQLKVVEDHEIPQVATIFQHFDSYEPKLSHVIVQKRINTRIFAAMSSRGIENPPPGTIVDHSITRRYWYDFLLVSQHVRQGTVSPTHYIVLRDGGNLKVDNMQRLTYKLTHLYYNWPGTVRVPAPCQYAHKLAYLIGQNVKKEPHEDLCNKLFFL